MLYLKLMSNQNMPDSCTGHNFTLVPVPEHVEITFRTDRHTSSVQVPDSTSVTAVLYDPKENTSREFLLSGNAYVLNEQGKTIASHSMY